MSFDAPTNQECYKVNMDLWTIFSDVFKDHNGFRPKGFWTEEEVVQWLDFAESEEMQKALAERNAMLDAMLEESIAEYEAQMKAERERLAEAEAEYDYYQQFGWIEEKFDKAA